MLIVIGGIPHLEFLKNQNNYEKCNQIPYPHTFSNENSILCFHTLLLKITILGDKGTIRPLLFRLSPNMVINNQMRIILKREYHRQSHQTQLSYLQVPTDQHLPEENQV